MNWLDLLAVQGTLKSLLQHHSSRASVLQRSAFIVQFSHPYMTTGKTIALTRQTFVGKVTSLLFNMLSAAVAKLLLCDPMDGSPPGSPVPGILQARTLEWVAMPCSRGSSQPKDGTWVSGIASGFFFYRLSYLGTHGAEYNLYIFQI